MAKAVYAFLFFFSLVLFTFSLSIKTFAQEKHVTFSYMAYFKQVVLSVKAITPTPEKVLGISTKSTVTVTPALTPQPTAIPVIQTSGVADFLLKKVNEYRSTFGLPAVQSSAEVCAFAATRAEEIAVHFSHDGFNTRVTKHTIPYAHWTRATENIAEAADYKQVVDLWAHSPEHAANMRDNTPYVCVAQSGNFFAYEGMRQ